MLSGAFFVGNAPVSFIFIAVSFGASLRSGKAVNKLNFKIRNEKNPHERKLGYVNRVFYLNDYAKEVRFNTEVSDELLKDFEENGVNLSGGEGQKLTVARVFCKDANLIILD